MSVLQDRDQAQDVDLRRLRESDQALEAESFETKMLPVKSSCDASNQLATYPLDFSTGNIMEIFGLRDENGRNKFRSVPNRIPFYSDHFRIGRNFVGIGTEMSLV